MAATLQDLFPGNTGRMLLVQVMLRTKRPELGKMPMDTPLDPTLESVLKQALIEVKAG